MANSEDAQDPFKQLTDQLVEIRGEALAGRVIAIFAMDWLVSRSTDIEGSLNRLEEAVDKSLNKMVHVGGDPKLNERVQEIARLRCQEALSEIRRTRTS